ncbi:histidinol phosphatase [Methanoculleus sp. FWC-SCC1]|uniref:Histidinol phosphatase n=1 Tax=Methanoculleus frigidifontis TaxID=2584085 RepID=A0ABT8M601_9EURY|nr:PHP domain-containing protein [Methanoculleus sp. FWC-SCC1]MDN7023364.1 histidinol phosphatase [Methanoculleus sp. FWC-SCC1]
MTYCARTDPGLCSEEVYTRETPYPDGMLLDMHVHSCHSIDSMTDIGAIVRTWQKRRILSLVCDHDSIEGSRRVYGEIRRYEPDIPLLLAEEITTEEGEIIGAFLTEEIPPGLSAAETLDRIQDQGAVSIVPHPFCTFRSTAIRREVLQECIGRIDVVEGYNARSPVPEENEMAQAYARGCSKPVSVGSDAHIPVELGRTYARLPPFEGPKDFVRAVSAAEIVFQKTHPAVHSVSRMVKSAKRAVGDEQSSIRPRRRAALPEWPGIVKTLL